MTRSTDQKDVLEQNVSTLLESGGEPPKLSDGARARIRTELIAKHGAVDAVKTRARVPLLAVGIGLAATAATALVVSRFVGSEETQVQAGTQKLADGSTFLTKGDAKVTVLGARRVRVEGTALLDIAPGKGTFVVETAAGKIEVLGTRFVVDAEAQKTTAAVVRGTVKLASDQGSVVVHAGEQAIAERGKAPTRGPAPRLSNLVSWAKSSRREDTTIAPVRNGSLFARDPGVRPNGQFGEEYPLPLKQLTLDVVVEDQVARVALDQTFHNPQPRVLEGVYKFAIPPDAALQRLAMYVDGKLTESAVVERQRARRIYEELVYRRIDPALLEYAGTGRLNLRVYPLPAQQDKRLMLAYTQSLPKLYNDWTLAIPLPEIDQPVGEMVVSARIKGCANCELTSPSHEIDVERKGEDAIVKYRRASEKIGDSFVVHVRDARRQTTVATMQEGSDNYLMVRAPVELGTAPREYRPRTWVILDDVSASRSAMELAAQADLVDAFLRELDEEDKVALVTFDVEARQKLAPTRVIDVDRRVVRAALKHEGGVGATDFRQGLDAALKLLKNVDPQDARVVYIGDGVITSGPRQLDVLRAQLAGKAQFIGVGVGDGPDTQTLEALAAASGGYATTIDLSDDIGWRAFDLIAALHTSRVTGLSAKLVDGSGQLVPATAYTRSAQLADGEELQLVAKLAGSATPVAVELSGTRGGQAWQQRIALAGTKSDAAGYLPRLWAHQHIGARMLAKHDAIVVPPCTSQPAKGDQPAVVCPTEAQLRTKRDEEIRQEIVQLGKQHFLLSRHTSLLVLENDKMYAQYGVRKGAGDTWAPYKLPESIPVVTAAPIAVPSNVADDAELVRAPLQIFYDSGYSDGWSEDGDSAFDDGFGLAFETGGGAVGLGRFGTIGHGSGTGSGFGVGGGRGGLRGRDEQAENERTRGSLGLVLSRQSINNPLADSRDDFASAGEDRIVAATSRSRFVEAKAEKSASVFAKGGSGKSFGPRLRAQVSSSELTSQGLLDANNARWRRMRQANHHGYYQYGVAAPRPQRLTYPTEQAFDDLTAFVPALVPDAADMWREELKAVAGNAQSFAIDDAAKRLLADARAKLPAGIYRWGGAELAIDSTRRFGWKRTTEFSLLESASFDGTSFVRTYEELGMTVTRDMREHAVALSLAYLPIWIAEPQQYARWFEVKAKGREVTLSTLVRGKPELAFTLAFDDQSRLVSMSDAEGRKLVEVTWSATGPTAAKVLGEAISVGFTPMTVADVVTWAQKPSPGVIVELPTRLPDYWRTKLAATQAGTAEWRHAQRQLMASAAAINDRATLARIFDELRGNGGVELGDLVLASGGIATAMTDKQFADALAVQPIATTKLAHYLVAGRAYGKNPKPARLAPETRDGLLGALWTLRSAQAQLAAAEDKQAVEQVLGLSSFTLRLVGVSSAGSRYTAKPEDTIRAWESVAIGEYKNIARAAMAQALYSRGQYDAAADRFAKLAEELDLAALPPQMNIGSYAFNYSRRGQAGYQLVYAKWRDRVVAGNSFAHVMSLVPQAAQHPIDLPRLLARALELAGKDPDKQLAVARTAINYGQQGYAQTLVEPLLKQTPSRELYQLAAQMAQGQSRLADALTYLEKAQEAGADEPVDLATIRNEIGQIIQLAQTLALQSTGPERKRAADRALEWATRWRMIDPGNADIDRRIGDVLLAIGDTAGAWRQLSGAIERDPWQSSGYVTVADSFERQGRVEEALELWQQAIVIDQTNPTPRLRKAQALFALGRNADGDALLQQIANGKWHDIWQSTVYQAKNLIERNKQVK